MYRRIHTECAQLTRGYPVLRRAGLSPDVLTLAGTDTDGPQTPCYRDPADAARTARSNMPGQRATGKTITLLAQPLARVML